MTKVKPKRPCATTSGVGMARHDLIRDAIDHYKKAMKEGYFIEAIALMESAISDRMESMLNYMFPYLNYSYGTIGNLAQTLKANKPFLNASIINILDKIVTWSKKRNDAIHQMVKLQPNGINLSFDQHYATLEGCAKEGYDLFRKFNAERNKIITYQNNHVLVYCLKDTENNPNNFPNEVRIKCKVCDVRKMDENGVFDESSYFEDEQGKLWRKQLLDMYYELDKDNMQSSKS